MHDIGKNVVAVILEGTGFEVIDLGVDISSRQSVGAVEKHSPDILGLTAMITPTMTAMERTIRALEEAELRGRVKVVIGGAPVTDECASGIGDDAYGSDVGQAVDVCRALLGRG
ncbi:MAG: B12-binding domain-containing protein [Dehalococcoidia bacterium]